MGRTLTGHRRPRRRRPVSSGVLWFVALLLLTLTIDAAPSQNRSRRPLFGAAPSGNGKSGAGSGLSRGPRNRFASRRIFAAVNTSLLSNGPDELDLNLFGDVELVAVRTELERTAGSRSSRPSVTWSGIVAGDQQSSIIRTVKGVRVTGIIRTGSKVYQLVPCGNKLSAVVEIDTSAFPNELHPPDIPAPFQARVETETAIVRSSRPDGRDEDDDELVGRNEDVEVDVMILYTPAARLDAGGSEAIMDLIDLAIKETNQAYQNSGINQRVRLVYVQEINYVESRSMTTDLNRLTRKTDGFMEEVHALRDMYQADMVSMLTTNNSNCGIAWLMNRPEAWFGDWAFSVVDIMCATGYLSLAHELGHNMGANHNREASDGNGSYPFSFGYRAPNFAFRTIMSYSCPGGCPRVPYFSNPALMYKDAALGVVSTALNSADNARTLNLNARLVAGFRSNPVATPVLPLPRSTTARQAPTTSPVLATTQAPQPIEPPPSPPAPIPPPLVPQLVRTTKRRTTKRRTTRKRTTSRRKKTTKRRKTKTTRRPRP